MKNYIIIVYVIGCIISYPFNKYWIKRDYLQYKIEWDWFDVSMNLFMSILSFVSMIIVFINTGLPIVLKGCFKTSKPPKWL